MVSGGDVREGSDGFWRRHFSEVPFVLMWWTFSIMLSLYNKEAYGEKKMDFPCPLLMTSTNFLFQWAAASIAVRVQPRMRQCADGSDPEPISWECYGKRLLPCALGVALDIGLSNVSLVHITVTFYTMVKATAPIFGLIFALLFGLERPRCEIFGFTFLIFSGLFVAAHGNAEFSPLGFGLIVAATATSGLRWNLLQLLLQNEPSSLPTSMLVLREIAPPAGLALLCMSIVSERPWTGSLNPFFASSSAVGKLLAMTCIGGLLAIGVSVASFALVGRTSVLMLMAFGALKEILTIFFSVLVYKDELTLRTVVGLVLVLTGVVLFKVFKIRQTERDGLPAVRGTKRGPVRYEMVSTELEDSFSYQDPSIDGDVDAKGGPHDAEIGSIRSPS